MIYAEILAGGKGTRMGNTDMPKQFLMLGDKPIFIHTVEQFLLNTKVEKILICTPKKWMAYTNDTLKKYIANRDKIVVVAGGASRNDTIMNGIKYIEDNYGLNDDDTVGEAFDAIVHSKDEEIITDIPVRSEMYQGQTPQSFNIKLLKSFFESLTEDEKEILTDACKALVMKGTDVHLVRGESYNMKITTQYDLKVANGLVERQNI